MGSIFSAIGQLQNIFQLSINIAGLITIQISGDDNRFNSEFEANGLIIFEASDGETLEVMIANADMDEPYFWTPSNVQEAIDFQAHIRGLTDQEGTLTLTGPPYTPPVITEITVDLTGFVEQGGLAGWEDNIDLGSVFSLDGGNQSLNFLFLVADGQVRFALTGANDRFTTDFEFEGYIVITASDGANLAFRLPTLTCPIRILGSLQTLRKSSPFVPTCWASPIKTLP